MKKLMTSWYRLRAARMYSFWLYWYLWCRPPTIFCVSKAMYEAHSTARAPDMRLSRNGILRKKFNNVPTNKEVDPVRRTFPNGVKSYFAFGWKEYRVIARNVAKVWTVPKQTRRGLIADEKMPTVIDCMTVCRASIRKLYGFLYLSSGLDTRATITPVERR